MTSSVPFNELEGANLVVDRVYQGGPAKNFGDEPINKLVKGVGNQGGIRGNSDRTIVVLYTTGEELAWPDALDPYSGILTYFGDNRKPGNDLHSTAGNKILRDAFANIDSPEKRAEVPIFLVFQKSGRGRDVLFRGLAVPGAQGVAGSDDLVAVWRAADGNRFQNYRATFTILDVPCVTARWLKFVRERKGLADDCPEAYRMWVTTGRHSPLLSLRIGLRAKKEQLPNENGMMLLRGIHENFKNNPYAFEACAVSIWKMLAPNTGEVTLTRPWRDGGRDAVGHYLFGPPADKLPVEFALEAKCYDPDKHGIGVKEMSRLISRIKHRQFGVFVTTSWYGKQAYAEIRADGHPIVLISGGDIVDALGRYGVQNDAHLKNWLTAVAGTGA